MFALDTHLINPLLVQIDLRILDFYLHILQAAAPAASRRLPPADPNGFFFKERATEKDREKSTYIHTYLVTPRTTFNVHRACLSLLAVDRPHLFLGIYQTLIWVASYTYFG